MEGGGTERCAGGAGTAQQALQGALAEARCHWKYVKLLEEIHVKVCFYCEFGAFGEI